MSRLLADLQIKIKPSFHATHGPLPPLFASLSYALSARNHTSHSRRRSQQLRFLGHIVSYNSLNPTPSPPFLIFAVCTISTHSHSTLPWSSFHTMQFIDPLSSSLLSAQLQNTLTLCSSLEIIHTMQFIDPFLIFAVCTTRTLTEHTHSSSLVIISYNITY